MAVFALALFFIAIDNHTVLLHSVTMNITTTSLLAGISCLILLTSCANSTAESKRFPNGFAEIGITDAQVDEKINATVKRFFHGSASERLYYESGDDMAYMLDVGNKDVRSEGMSYGMMFTVQLDMKPEFDRLWKFAHEKMLNKSGDYEGYFAWHVTPEGKVIDANPASDGEQYFAAALFMASSRWGDGEGILNYRAEANKILDHMLRHRELINAAADSRVTDMIDPKTNQVVFVPEGLSAGFTDPSYHIPHFYELFAQWADKDKDRWAAIAAESRNLFRKACNANTGLAADYAGFDGTPVQQGSHYRFEYDAWRVAMNIALDSLWWNKDAWQRDTWAKTYLGFFKKQGMGVYKSLYDIDGNHASGSHSTGLVAMNAVASLIGSKEDRKAYLKEFWTTPIPSGTWRYYDGCLYLFGMMQVSGRFRPIGETRR